jgi:hypothetical protein
MHAELCARPYQHWVSFAGSGAHDDIPLLSIAHQGISVQCMDTAANRKLLAGVPHLHSPYHVFPDPFPDRGHVETLIGSLVRTLPEVPYR